MARCQETVRLVDSLSVGTVEVAGFAGIEVVRKKLPSLATTILGWRRPYEDSIEEAFSLLSHKLVDPRELGPDVQAVLRCDEDPIVIVLQTSGGYRHLPPSRPPME